MEKFIPYAKLSKKKKRELDTRKRGSWGALNPVTRKSPDPRAYNRRKARKQDFDETDSVPFIFFAVFLAAAAVSPALAGALGIKAVLIVGNTHSSISFHKRCEKKRLAKKSIGRG